MSALTVHPPLTCHALRVYFLETPTTTTLPNDFVGLLDAIQAGLVTVEEQRQPTIRSLRVNNRSQRLVFVLPGTVVLGGWQDRVIATAAVLEPGVQTVDLSAFCVEPARWHATRGRNFYISGAKDLHYAPHRIRYASLHRRSQGEVWEETGAYKRLACAAIAAPLVSSSLRDVIEYEHLAAQVAELTQQLQQALTSYPRANGVAFALNGILVEIDLFGSRQLLEICYPTLVQSYIRDAVILRSARHEQEEVSPEEICRLAQSELIAKSYETSPAQQNRLVIGPVADHYDALVLRYRDQPVYKQILCRV